ncbi:UNVERIFIED_CONTAM: hypothetical protein GTU68_055425 [Idotea baltica]|nr:hypothetical protein [Idotea baltica]
MRGRARVKLVGGAKTSLKSLHQSGSAKIFLPRVHTDRPEVVFLNTAGGITGGDHLSFSAELETSAKAVLTTQTAERAYASTGAAGKIDISLTVGQGAYLEWLPQETILFEASHTRRDTQIDLACDAGLLMVETVALGRQAMGEDPRTLIFHDRRLVRRAGRPVFLEPFTLGPANLDALETSATFGSARAISTIALIAQGAEDVAKTVRGLELPDAVEMGCSGWDGKTIIRLLAPDMWPMRQALNLLLTQIRGRALPRVWQI